MKKIISFMLIIFSLLLLTACCKADVIKHNIRVESDKFETYRKVTVINLRSDKILLEVEGFISIKDSTDKELAIIIKVDKNQYQMHYIYTGSETVYLVEQIDYTYTDPYHYEINIFAVLPNITTD